MKLNKNNSVDGFMDGYKARNIEILEDKLFYDMIDLEKIVYLLYELTKSNSDYKSENERLKKLETYLKDTRKDILSRLVEFGSEFYNFIELASSTFKDEYMNRITEVTIKYLNICEKSNNEELLKRAINVSSKVKS